MDKLMKDSIAFFGHIGQLYRRGMDQALGNRPRCHFGILHRVAAAIEMCGQDGSIPVSELTRMAEDSPQAVSRWLRILEQDGLAERCPDPRDRRKTTVRLTPAGEQAHAECAQALMEYGAAVADRIGPERLQRLQEDFIALAAAMEAETQARSGPN